MAASSSSVIPAPLAHADNQEEGHPHQGGGALTFLYRPESKPVNRLPVFPHGTALKSAINCTTQMNPQAIMQDWGVLVDRKTGSRARVCGISDHLSYANHHIQVLHLSGDYNTASRYMCHHI
ncbi:hypothetical protein TNCV_3340981 [Trichonephila clavipes]|nr:hypothetical protein TNCV_3340981 [Trichonephila clavipes]